MSKKNKPAYFVRVGISPEVDHALSFFDLGLGRKTNRKFAIDVALEEGILAMVEHFERTGHIAVPIRFDVVEGPRRFLAAAEERKTRDAQIDAVLEQATKAAEDES